MIIEQTVTWMNTHNTWLQHITHINTYKRPHEYSELPSSNHTSKITTINDYLTSCMWDHCMNAIYANESHARLQHRWTLKRTILVLTKGRKGKKYAYVWCQGQVLGTTTSTCPWSIIWWIVEEIRDKRLATFTVVFTEPICGMRREVSLEAGKSDLSIYVCVYISKRIYICIYMIYMCVCEMVHTHLYKYGKNSKGKNWKRKIQRDV